MHYSNGNERIRCAFVRFCAKGNKAFSAKEFEKAIQHYTAALQFTPRCVCVLCSCLALDGLLFFFFFFFFFWIIFEISYFFMLLYGLSMS